MVNYSDVNIGAINDAFDKTSTVFKKIVVSSNVCKSYGVVSRINGITLEGTVLNPKIGQLCQIIPTDAPNVLAEVVGFSNNECQLSALGNLDGISSGDKIETFARPHSLYVDEGLLGRVFDGFGRSFSSDGADAFAIDDRAGRSLTPVIRDAEIPINKPRITTPLYTGVRAIDALNTFGEGQRVGVFAGAGCGKTTLLASLARGTDADIIVFGLIGERGRELREFLDHELDDYLRSKSVLICATSDRSSMERARAAFTATAIAEGFRDKGKKVLLLLDSLTRFARAQREIGLASGEPPAKGGFPPSVYTLLPKLTERSGRTNQGSITSIYTVLIEQDSMSDPIADEVRSLLDGHIVLSRKLAESGHYPAIDVLASLSRVMGNITSPEHVAAASQFRSLLSKYKSMELLIKLGEYEQGSDYEVDRAISLIDEMNKFLIQSTNDITYSDNTISYLLDLIG